MGGGTGDGRRWCGWDRAVTGVGRRMGWDKESIIAGAGRVVLLSQQGLWRLKLPYSIQHVPSWHCCIATQGELWWVVGDPWWVTYAQRWLGKWDLIDLFSSLSSLRHNWLQEAQVCIGSAHFWKVGLRKWCRETAVQPCGLSLVGCSKDPSFLSCFLNDYMKPVGAILSRP